MSYNEHNGYPEYKPVINSRGAVNRNSQQITAYEYAEQQPYATTQRTINSQNRQSYHEHRPHVNLRAPNPHHVQSYTEQRPSATTQRAHYSLQSHQEYTDFQSYITAQQTVHSQRMPTYEENGESQRHYSTPNIVPSAQQQYNQYELGNRLHPLSSDKQLSRTPLTEKRSDTVKMENAKFSQDFLTRLDAYEAIIPDEVTNYFMRTSGLPTDDERVTKLIAVAAQKFISDILLDARELARIDQPPIRGTAAKVCLTTDLLHAALRERGIEVVRHPLHH